MAKITILGLAGTGKSTTAKMLASKLGYEYMSTGNMYRGYAKELGLTLNEFEEVANKTKEYDIRLDTEVEEYGKTHDNFIFESWLAWHFIPDSFKINLVCDFDVRTGRIANRESKSVEQVKDETNHRENILTKKYAEYYGIEKFYDVSHSDFIVDTEKNNAEQVVEIILTELKNRGLI